MSGKGEMVEINGTIYKGKFNQNKLEGKGEVRFPSGKR